MHKNEGFLVWEKPNDWNWIIVIIVLLIGNFLVLHDVERIVLHFASFTVALETCQNGKYKKIPDKQMMFVLF